MLRMEAKVGVLEFVLVRDFCTSYKCRRTTTPHGCFVIDVVCVYVCMSVCRKSSWVLSFQILAMGFLGVHNSKMNVSQLGDS